MRGMLPGGWAGDHTVSHTMWPVALLDPPQQRGQHAGVARDRDMDRLELDRPGDHVERLQPVEHELERERLPAAAVAALDVEGKAAGVQRVRVGGLDVAANEPALVRLVADGARHVERARA